MCVCDNTELKLERPFFTIEEGDWLWRVEEPTGSGLATFLLNRGRGALLYHVERRKKAKNPSIPLSIIAVGLGKVNKVGSF